MWTLCVYVQMLYMAAQKAIKRHGINKRQQVQRPTAHRIRALSTAGVRSFLTAACACGAVQAEAERKDEVRRMQERMGAEPCGDGAWPRGAA
jgi:hypothetical protein